MNYEARSNQTIASNSPAIANGTRRNSAIAAPAPGWSAMKRNFILQMGFDDPASAVVTRQYSALTFQPRVVLVLAVTGILFQSPTVFAAICAMLWVSALFPKLNPLSALYNLTIGGRPGAFRLGPAPAPRRGAETMAGAFALAIALLILTGFHLAAYVLQGIFLAASLAVEFAGFCFGTFAYHLRRGNVKFALQTLPWAKNELGNERRQS
jgi:uncharacterized protein DUF4395